MLESGMQDDIVNFLKKTNKLLGFLEEHSGGLYKTLKLIGVSLLTFAGVMALINLPGTVLALGEAVELLINIRKNLLMIQLMSLSMAGTAGVEAGASAGILLFLTQPEIWIPLAIAALGAVLMFVLNKFFPNVYNSIAVWWDFFKNDVRRFLFELMRTPFMKTLSEFFGHGTEKSAFKQDVQAKQNKWRQFTPNHQFIFNLGGLLDAFSMHTYRNMNPFAKSIGMQNQLNAGIVKHIIEQKFKIDIKVDGVDDKKTIMDSVHSAIENFAEKNKKQTVIDIINSKFHL